MGGVERKLESALTEAKIALANAQTEYNISMLSAKSTYDSSVKEGSSAAANYQAALTASEERIKGLEGEIRLLELEITMAQEKLADGDLLDSYEEAKTAYTQAKNRYEETDLHNSTAYTSNLTDYQQAKSRLETLEEELQGYRDTVGDNQAEIEKKKKEINEAEASQVLKDLKAENSYHSAWLSGELAKEIYDYSVDSLQDSVNQAQNELDEIQAKMDAFRDFVGEDNRIYAPEDGLVTGVSYEAGDKLTDSRTMLTYAKENEYTVNIDVSEEDVAGNFRRGFCRTGFQRLSGAGVGRCDYQYCYDSHIGTCLYHQLSCDNSGTGGYLTIVWRNDCGCHFCDRFGGGCALCFKKSRI